MTKLYPLLCSILLVLFSGPLYAQERDQLYTKSPSEELEKLAKSIRDPNEVAKPVDQLRRPDRYFVRIVERKYVLSEQKELLGTAVLGSAAKPLVFLTTPEGFIGKSLLEMFEDIGYEAEDVLRSYLNKEMVAVLFRYPENITLSNVKNGHLERDWRSRIYPTTWDNAFSLFTRLVQDERSAACTKKTEPSQYICVPPQDTAFVMRFPLGAKRQLKTKTKSYPVLQATGGPLWRYRKLLEDKLSLFEHFRGDGRTENEVHYLREPRLYEVIGPNKNINDLPELIIIDLGKLTIGDCYSRN